MRKCIFVGHHDRSLSLDKHQDRARARIVKYDENVLLVGNHDHFHDFEIISSFKIATKLRFYTESRSQRRGEVCADG